MTKLIISTFILSLISGVALSQPCRYEINKTDAFTKKEIKVTKEKVVWKNPAGFNSLSFKAKKLENEKFLQLRYSKIGKTMTVQSASKLMLLLENETIIELDAVETVFSDSYISGGSVVWFVEPSYSTSKEKIDQISTSPIKMIRFYTEGGFIEHEIKTKKRTIISNLLGCL